MIVWPAKDPAEELDYSWRIPLDEGDSVLDATGTTSSSVAIDSQAPAGGLLTLWLSGGTDGESAIFDLRATTAGGRTIRETAILPVFDRASEFLAMFRLRYPEFATVEDGTIGYWLAGAGSTVGGWSEEIRDPARLALAAHQLALAGHGSSGGQVSELASLGVTAFRSASFSVSFDAGTIEKAAGRGYNASRYGQEFLGYLRRNGAGPRLVGLI